MPTAAMASHYWPGDGIEGEEPPEDTAVYHYPYWFNASSVSFLGFGQFQLPVPRQRYQWERYVKKLKGLIERLYRSLPLRVLLIAPLLRAYFSSDFNLAVSIVTQVANDPSSRNLEYWGEISRRTVSNKKQGENMYRGLMARTKLDNPILLELAWLAVKRKH